uniref:Uncharacterized protein n=1 Tax=Anguilla anguilla TaxID=7936 RepID=A0A0E9SGS8_ANGAN
MNICIAYFMSESTGACGVWDTPNAKERESFRIQTMRTTILS